MIPILEEKPITDLSKDLKLSLHDAKRRLGLITSVDGKQLATLIIDLSSTCSKSFCWITPIEGNTYNSLASHIPQAHWFEREMYDMFAIHPLGHPRLKSALLNEAYPGPFAPLNQSNSDNYSSQNFNYMGVSGKEIFELPVGPVHAGIIEPGHFRFSCIGEKILNLEIRLGFLHRGIEKRLTELPWTSLRFGAEAVSSDTAAANALASAKALESLLHYDATEKAKHFRLLALEIERIAMHIFDIGGMAADLGYCTMAAAFSTLRGSALYLAELLSGSRFLRGFICPGGVTKDPDRNLSTLKNSAKVLRTNLKKLTEIFLSNSDVYERLHGVGTLSASLAKDFGLVGVVARASAITYDVRSAIPETIFPNIIPQIAVEQDGDALARTKVRIAELDTSFNMIEALLDNLPSDGKIKEELPSKLEAESCGLGIVEAFRGELIHLIFTDKENNIKRYVVKDPSSNNWTGLAIAIRNNVIADFPICNKSFALSYSGHDL